MSLHENHRGLGPHGDGLEPSGPPQGAPTTPVRYRATYETRATVTVDLVLDPNDPPHGFDTTRWDDEFYVEEWVAEETHRVASGAILTWGTVGDARLDMGIDGIGADTIEEVTP